MKKFRLKFYAYSFIIMVVVSILGCGGGGNAVKSTDHANIQGVWLALTESQNGVRRDVSYQYVFKGDTLTFTDETGEGLKYSFKLDTNNNPRLIFVKPLDEVADTSSVTVAYELKGDTLKIVVPPQHMLPTDISDKNNQELIISKRKAM